MALTPECRRLVAAEEVYEKADDAPANFLAEEHEEPRPGKRRLIAGMVVVLGLGAAAGWYMQQGGQASHLHRQPRHQSSKPCRSRSLMPSAAFRR